MTYAKDSRAATAPHAHQFCDEICRRRERIRFHRARGVLCAIAALSFLSAPAAEARSHGTGTTDSVRVTLGPGVSVAFPQDWFSCDAGLNEQLHNVPLPRETASRLCAPVGGGNAPVHLIGLSPRAPASLLADRTPIPTVSGQALSQATPEMVDAVGQIICSHIADLLGVAPQVVTACSGGTQSVSDHTGFVTRLSISDPGGHIHRVRIYRFPYDQGEMTLQFEYPAAAEAASAARVDAIVSSLRIEPGTFVAQPVTLTPAPGISLSLPSGWMACDNGTNALLGNAPDGFGVREKSCADISPNQRLAAFNPQLLQNVTVGVAFKTEKDLSESQIADLSADRLTELTPKICDSVTKPIRDQERPVDSCVLSLEQIGGHQALVVTMVAALADDDKAARDRGRIYLVPYDQGFATLEFIVPLASEQLAQPLIDAVMKSLVIQ